MCFFFVLVVSKRKFWNPKKWFRKKQKTGEGETVVHPHHQEQRDVEGNRSRSTGELSTDEELPKRYFLTLNFSCIFFLIKPNLIK